MIFCKITLNPEFFTEKFELNDDNIFCVIQLKKLMKFNKKVENLH
jgi:hypothetical protein